MNTPRLQILLCTNGFEATRPALSYGIWLAELLQLHVVLLGVLEHPEDRQRLDNLVEETAKRLEEKKIIYVTMARSGRASIEISKHAQQGNYLTVVGPFGRPTWRRWVRGRTFRRLLARMSTPLLYVPVGVNRINHILLCMGGLGFAFSMEHMALYLAQATGARFTLLNIVEPITLDYPTSRQAHDDWKHLMDTKTPQGENLQRALKEAQQAGLKADVKIRHGNIVREIMQELHNGDYDLVGLGSPYSVRGLRQLYMPNVTAEVAEAANCPVLTVRSGYEFEG